MKRVWCSLAALAALHLPATGAEQLTAETVVERAVEAIGGRSVWDAIETVVLRGSFTTFSSQNPFVIHRKRPNLYRFEHWEVDKQVIVGFDGDQAWWQNQWIPFSEVDWPTAPPVEYSRGYEADAEFGAPFLDYREKGHRIELVGTGDFEGTRCHELLIELSSGTSETWYLDAATYLPVARRSKAGYTMLEVEQVTFFSEYRRVSEALFPHHVESELGNRFGVMIVEEVEVNPALDDALFRMPVPAAVEPLSRLTGSWKVSTSSRHYQPTLPPKEDDQGTATFRTLHQGRVLEEELSFLFYGRPRSLKRFYTYDRFRDSLRIVQIDNLTTHPILFDGGWSDDGTLTASNLETGTEWGVLGQSQHNRLVLYDFQEDRFKADWDFSPDAGKTWITLAELVYQREAADSASAAD